jgi:hypothetical protein
MKRFSMDWAFSSLRAMAAGREEAAGGGGEGVQPGEGLGREGGGGRVRFAIED